MTITPHLFEAYLKCPTKCWLRSHDEPDAGNGYAEWVRLQNESYRIQGIKRIMEGIPSTECLVGPNEAAVLKTVNWRLAVDFVVRTPELECCLHAIERIPEEGRGKRGQFIPIRFVFSNKLTKDDRLLVAFDTLMLSKMFTSIPQADVKSA